MFTYESGRRATDPDDRAQDYLVSKALEQCSVDDVDAAVRVLHAMSRRDLLAPLAARMAYDGAGNPIMGTAEQRLAQQTWAAASEQMDRLDGWVYALRSLANGSDR